MGQAPRTRTCVAAGVFVHQREAWAVDLLRRAPQASRDAAYKKSLATPQLAEERHDITGAEQAPQHLAGA